MRLTMMSMLTLLSVAALLTTACRRSTRCADAPDLPSPDVAVEYDLEPELLRMSDPVYPDPARAQGIQGVVLVRVLVGKDGNIKDMIIIQSVPALDDVAIEACRTAVFKPGLCDGDPVAVWMVIPIEFKLHG